MIKSRRDYIFYLESDAIALGINRKGFPAKIRDFFAPNYIWKFQRSLRRVEYLKNCSSNPFTRFNYVIAKLKFRKMSLRLGFSIPENVFGPGLAIVHYGTIVINSNARIGANCRIHACTNIGASGGTSKAPIIGDNVYIGPGAKIYGAIKIANNIAISANTTVFKSFEEGGIMIAGNPAKKIKEIEIKNIIKHIQ